MKNMKSALVVALIASAPMSLDHVNLRGRSQSKEAWQSTGKRRKPKQK